MEYRVPCSGLLSVFGLPGEHTGSPLHMFDHGLPMTAYLLTLLSSEFLLLYGLPSSDFCAPGLPERAPGKDNILCYLVGEFADT